MQLLGSIFLLQDQMPFLLVIFAMKYPRRNQKEYFLFFTFSWINFNTHVTCKQIKNEKHPSELPIGSVIWNVLANDICPWNS